MASVVSTKLNSGECMSKEDDEVSWGVAAIIALIVPVIGLISMFTFGIPLGLAGKFAWNELIAVWLPLPTATIWNMWGLMIVASLFIPTPSKMDWKTSLLVNLFSKPLFILAATIIIS